jgi:hypothetical protein
VSALLGPFDQQDRSTVDQLVKPRIDPIGWRLKPIQIEMVNL